MGWKFWESEPTEPTETRQMPFTDAVIDMLQGGAAGADDVTPGRTGIQEACAGLWARSFATADVTPQTAATAGLTPQTLEMIGRQLFENGQIVFAISIAAGRVALIPASSWTITGQDVWEYELTLPTPNAIVTRFLPADGVVHLRYGADIQQPWTAAGPLQRGKETAQLQATLERRLTQEAAMPVGSVLPMPDTTNTGQLQTDIAGLRGKTVLVPSTSSGWEQGERGAPRADWQPRRLGAMFPASHIDLRAGAADHLAAAGGVPPVLLRSDNDSGAQREGWRQFLHGTIQPAALIVLGELRDKLATPDLQLSFDRLMASDLSGRARAFQSLVGGGMEISKAAGLAGLMQGEE